MATHTSLRSLFSAIANAIRAKTDGSADIVADDFPTAIAAIPTGTTPTGTKQISITQNGTTTEDVASYASAEIETRVGLLPLLVPSGYTQLDYIESSGTQVIQSNVHMTLDTEVEITYVSISGTLAGYSAPVNCKNPNLTIGSINSYDVSHPAGGYMSFGNKGDFTGKFAVDTKVDTRLDIRYIPTVSLNATELRIKQTPLPDQVVTCGATSLGTDDGNDICLFARKSGTTYERFGSFRVFRVKISDAGTLVRDFIPAMRDSDGEVGMYDIVNDVFYTNSGTGVFVGGTT